MGGAAASAFAATALLLAGCGSSEHSNGPRSTTSSSAEATTIDATDAAQPFPPSQTPIEPGTYRWSGFEPSITITVGSGWALGHDDPAFFDLFRGSDFPSVTFGRFTDVYVDEATRAPAADVASVTAALTARVDVLVTDEADIELGGLTGHRFDVVTLAPRTPLFFGPAGDFQLDPNFQTRFSVLDFPGGGVLVIGIHTHDGGFDDAVTLAGPLVESLTVDG